MSYDLLSPSYRPTVSTEEVEDRHCPACGHARFAGVTDDAWQPRPFPIVPALLGAIGVFLIVVYGWRASAIQQALVSADTYLVQPSLCAIDNSVDSRCQAILGRRAALLATRPRSKVSPGELEQNLVTAAIGATAVVVGVGRVIRRRRPIIASGVAGARHSPQIANPPQPSDTPQAAWEIGDQWLLSVLRALLLLLGFAVLGRLIQGDVPTWGLLDESIGRVSAAVIETVSTLLG